MKYKTVSHFHNFLRLLTGIFVYIFLAGSPVQAIETDDYSRIDLLLDAVYENIENEIYETEKNPIYLLNFPSPKTQERSFAYKKSFVERNFGTLSNKDDQAGDLQTLDDRGIITAEFEIQEDLIEVIYEYFHEEKKVPLESLSGNIFRFKFFKSVLSSKGIPGGNNNGPCYFKTLNITPFSKSFRDLEDERSVSFLKSNNRKDGLSVSKHFLLGDYPSIFQLILYQYQRIPKSKCTNRDNYILSGLISPNNSSNSSFPETRSPVTNTQLIYYKFKVQSLKLKVKKLSPSSEGERLFPLFTLNFSLYMENIYAS